MFRWSRILLEHQKWFYSLKFLWNRSQSVYHDPFCLFNVLTEVLHRRNLCFISDQLQASKTSNVHRHALYQVLLYFYFSSMFVGIVRWSASRPSRLGRSRKVCSHLIICCFLWMYRIVLFNLSIVLGLCLMALLFALFYISRSARSIGNTIG